MVEKHIRVLRTDDGGEYGSHLFEDFCKEQGIKRQLTDKFQEFKDLVEKQIGKHIRVLRTEDGGEYESHLFEDFAKKMASKDNSQFPTTLNKMGLPIERTKLSVKLPRLCYLIRTYQIPYG